VFFNSVHYAKDICRDRSDLTSSLDHVRTDQALGNLLLKTYWEIGAAGGPAGAIGDAGGT